MKLGALIACAGLVCGCTTEPPKPPIVDGHSRRAVNSAETAATLALRADLADAMARIRALEKSQQATQGAAAPRPAVVAQTVGPSAQASQPVAASTPSTAAPAAAAAVAPPAPVAASAPVPAAMPVAAPTAAATTAAAKPVASTPPAIPAPAPQWRLVPADDTLSAALTRWGSVAGYQVVWQAPKDLPVYAATYTGSFETAVEQVMRDTTLGAYPLHACLYDNGVLRVLHSTQSCGK